MHNKIHTAEPPDAKLSNRAEQLKLSLETGDMPNGGYLYKQFIKIYGKKGLLT